MKINGFSSEVLRLLYGETPLTERGRRKERGQVSGPVSVELSGELTGVSPQEVSKEKVERIREAIKSGSYQVNPHRISGRS